MWIDTHCHLDAAEFDADRDGVAAAARSAGVTTIVVPAVEVANFPAVRDCCRRYPGCVPAYGIHPMYTPQAGDGDLQVLRDWLVDERPAAIGEIGLDFFVTGLDPARQQHFFVEQLKLAREFDLPVLLHVRRAIDPILKELRRYQVRGGIAHAFNGSRQQADAFIGLGFKLGFGGAMTWSRATRLRSLAAELPHESVVLETDAPDIPPEFAPRIPPGNRARNEPKLLPEIAETLMRLWGVDAETLATITSRNALSIFRNITQ